MPVRAVLFDIGETLWHSDAAPPASEFRRLAAQRAADAFAAMGVPCADPSLAARVAWDSLEIAMRAARKSDRVEPDYAAEAARALSLYDVTVSTAQAAQLLDAIYVSGMEGGKAAYRDAADVLSELRRRGFLLATVTNRAFGGERFRADLQAVGLDIGWDALVVSVEVGFLKPHPAIFEHALELLEIAPDEALMVGNSLAEDVAGAQRLGIRTAWRRSPPDAEGVTPDYEFDELHELLDIPVLNPAAS